MDICIAFIRTLFAFLCVFFVTSYVVAGAAHPSAIHVAEGIGGGLLLSLFLFGCDLVFRRFNLRSFNITIVGLFIGYLMGEALTLVFENVLKLSSATADFSPSSFELLKIAIFLFGTYLGILMTLRFANELYISIPFVKFNPSDQKRRDLLLDVSLLSDARLVDLAATSLLNGQIVIARFTIRELYSMVESPNEHDKIQGKKGLEIFKKLEGMAGLNITWQETDFPEVKEHAQKLARLARLTGCNILTADISSIPLSVAEGVHVISINSLSSALKPLMHEGEYIKIKIQRQGKEPRQGVGYLDDGTMVVINGGGSSIGKTIQAVVLSIKASSAGRIIFCNAAGSSSEHGFHEDFEDFEDA